MKKLLLIAALMALATLANAQRLGGPPGVPASVTSITPQNPTPGVPASVTSFSANHPPQSTGFTAFNPPPMYGVLGANQTANGFNGAFRGGFHGGFNGGFHHGHHRRDNFVAVPYGYAYPVYVPAEPDYDSGPDMSTYDLPSGNAMDREMWSRAAEREDRAIDRRDDYAAGREDAREQYRDMREQQKQEAAEQLPKDNETQLVLVMKDGTRVELGNYAIVGSTFYDLVHHGKKYLVADLDLTKTQKANEDMGFDFRLPASALR